MSNNIHIVIMAGGSGTRFWPYSRENRPKQFLDIIGSGRSLLQMTFDRFLKITKQEKMWVVTNEKYKALIHEQLPELTEEHILLEPARRNTAPCIAYASYKMLQEDPNAVMVVTPSDHAISNEDKFNAVVHTAIKEVSHLDRLITIGIRPNRPETGYGYIQYLSNPGKAIKKVKTFTEKPPLDMAKKFIESGDFLWNSGIFVWTIKSIIKAFERYEEEMSMLWAEGNKAFFSKKENHFIKKVYSQCKNVSIDYAILEKAENVYVVPGDFDWLDLGSWNNLYEIKDKDKNNNAIAGSVMAYDSQNNFINGNQKKLTIIQGMEGYLVVDCDDLLLICKKEDSAIFKNFIMDIKSKRGEKYL